MLRMGRNPKDQPGGEHTTDQPQPQASSQPGGDSQFRPPDQSASTSRPVLDSQTPSVSRAITESESLARDIKEGTLSGFVGNGTTLTGEAAFKGMLRVDGHLSGRVSSEGGTLIVSTGGQVDANVEVSVAMINGTVNGDIIATKRIELGRVARVTGNIQTPALVIEQGAVFEGSCRMSHLKEAQDRQREEEPRAAAGTSGASPNATKTESSDNSGAASSTERPGTKSQDTSQRPSPVVA